MRRRLRFALWVLGLSGVAVMASAVAAAAAAGAGARSGTAARSAAGTDRVVLAGTVQPLALPRLEVGRTDPGLRMERIILRLALRPGARERLERLLAAQLDPASPEFHRWLTPEEFGAWFGLGDGELRRVIRWLSAQGFTIDEVARGRRWINVSGTAGQVEAAFRTEMHDYRIDGEVRHAAAVAPSVPRALAGLIHGIVSLDDVPLAAPPLVARRRALAAAGDAGEPPRFNAAGGGHLLAPADLATVYDFAPLYRAGIDGLGQGIAVLGRSDIKLEDVRAFRGFFGLPPNDPVLVHNGPDPGFVNVYDEGESDLDVEWAGAVAPRATVELVISGSTGNTDGIALSAQYAVDHNLAPVVSVSYGLCELLLGPSRVAFWNDVWSQAAAQGITVVTAAGDSGPAGCDPPNTPRASRSSVNGVGSTPYDVCVGGTQFDDTADPGAWWAAVADPVSKGSARSYIPEIAWNESGAVAGGAGLWSSGGGASAAYPKPAWQAAPGVPADGARDVPDVSLAGAAHAAYVYLEEGQMLTIGGTSGGAPAFAALMALLVQRVRERQGNANPFLYQLGSRQYAGRGGPAVFHDVTSGDNSVPGVAGFSAGPGYDQVTGLGSIDAAALVSHWPNVQPGVFCVPGPHALCIDDQPGDARFQVGVSFAAGTQTGNAQAISLDSLGIAEGGLFWFFAAANPELLIKVLDACQLNRKFWVFFAATTDVGFTVTVTDTLTGHSKQYSNPPHTPAAPIQDTAAFDCG
jgi:pseudomonalisin